MKHLKPFNEAVGDTFAQELQDFCEMNGYKQENKSVLTKLKSFFK